MRAEEPWRDPLLEAWPPRGEVVVFDLEYTAWEGSWERGWSEPWEHREVIQIGALRLDVSAGFKELDAFEILVRPTVNSDLSDYIIRLTGITNERLSVDGVPFDAAFSRFCSFVENATLWCNGLDGAVLRENCRLNRLRFPYSHGRIRNIGPALAQACEPPRGSVVSGELPELLGLSPSEDKHSGLGDARSIARGLGELRRQGRV